MLKKIKNVVLVIGVTIQVAAMLLYSFSEIGIPGYLYMIVWIICALLMKSSVNDGKII